MRRSHRSTVPPNSKGVVYLVGAGPGDPGLLTVRGRELLARAGLVIYDHLVSPRLLRWCEPTTELRYVGKEARKHTISQAKINRLLIRAARAGKIVVRLKGGDPFVFGRGGEEALALKRANVMYEIVPGVTSALAVPAYAGIPVTHRGFASSVALVTGHEDPTKAESVIHWEQLSTACDTLVFLMGVSTLPNIVAQLIRYGRNPTTPCAVIEWGTCPQQRTVVGTLKTMTAMVRRAAVRPPAILVVGEVVSLRQHLNWFESKPLFGKRVLVTRAADKAALLTDQLEMLGAEVEELPAIQLVPIKHDGMFRHAVREMPRADWVFFTSPEGIRWFAKMLKPYRKDLRWLSGCHIGAIGSKTAVAIEAAGLHVDFVPKRFSQEGILEEFPSRVLEGKRAFIFSAEESRDVLERGLRKQGMEVRKFSIYRTVIPNALLVKIGAMFERSFDLVTVTSASCVDHLVQALRASGKGQLIRTLRFASIGPVTSQAVRDQGGRVAVEAKTSTIEGIVEAVKRWGAHRSFDSPRTFGFAKRSRGSRSPARLSRLPGRAGFRPTRTGGAP